MLCRMMERPRVDSIIYVSVVTWPRGQFYFFCRCLHICAEVDIVKPGRFRLFSRFLIVGVRSWNCLRKFNLCDNIYGHLIAKIEKLINLRLLHSSNCFDFDSEKQGLRFLVACRPLSMS